MKENKIQVLGVGFDAVTMDQALDAVGAFLDSDTQHFVVTPNPEICLLAYSDSVYRNLLNSADLSIADGFGIVWAGRYLQGAKNIFRWFWTCYVTFARTAKYSPFSQRVTGTDLMNEVCKKYPSHKVYLLGAGDSANALTVKYLSSTFGTHVVGRYTGDPSKEREQEICYDIDLSGAEILFVAFGAPLQEEWIHRNLNRLPRVRVAVGVGGAFDFLSQTKKRAPGWIRNSGFEWLYRLCIEPSRWRRIARAFFVFPWRVLTFRD